jgi:hypothetical protein
MLTEMTPNSLRQASDKQLIEWGNQCRPDCATYAIIMNEIERRKEVIKTKHFAARAAIVALVSSLIGGVIGTIFKVFG